MSGEIIGGQDESWRYCARRVACRYLHGQADCLRRSQSFMPKMQKHLPIVEGALTTTFYGKGVALAGMKTACGAVLIASQFTDIVEYGGGAAAAGGSNRKPSTVATNNAMRQGVDDVSARSETGTFQYDDRFVLVDESSGKPLAHTEYAIRRASGAVEHGTTDVEGHTHLLSATFDAEVIDIYV